MKEKRNIYCLKALTVAAVICFAGCSDDFLKDKKVYGSYDSSVVYENYETATSRVDYLYQCLLPSATGGSNALTDITSAGRNSMSSHSLDGFDQSCIAPDIDGEPFVDDDGTASTSLEELAVPLYTTFTGNLPLAFKPATISLLCASTAITASPP